MTYIPDGITSVVLSDIAFLFHVMIGGLPLGDFQAVENLQRKFEPYEYKEGGRNFASHQLVGQHSYGELTLKWGLMERPFLYDWMDSVEVGENFRQSVIITQLTRTYLPRRMFFLERCWPTAWKGAALQVEDNKLPIEELTLSFDHLEVVVNPLPEF